MAEAEEEKTPLQQKLDEFGEQLSKVHTRYLSLAAFLSHPIFSYHSGHLSHLRRCLGNQHWTLQRSCSWWIMASWCYLLLQDCCCSRLV